MDAGVANVYNDFSGLRELRYQASENPTQAIKEVAQQFESIFVSMVMKSMRDASPEGGLFNSDQMGTYQEMFDQQLAVNLSNSGGLGLASIIEKQISISQR